MLKKLLIFVLLVTLSLMPLASVLAQSDDKTDDTTEEAEATEEPAEDLEEALEEEDSTFLTYGVPVNGEILDGAIMQEWTLEVDGADRISVRVERTGGNLIPDVSVLNSAGSAVGQSRGADRTLAVASIDRADLGAPGTFTVQVGRDRAENGTTTGTYSLLVTPFAAGEDHPNNSTVIDAITYDEPVSGEITAMHWRHVYSLSADAQDYINVTAIRSDGTLVPLVDIIDSTGRSLRTGRANEVGTVATTDYQLPEAGEYTIVITRDRGFGGTTEGEYAVVVTLLGAGEGSSLLAGAVGTVEYDEPTSGNINAQWYQDWELVTDSADTLTILVERTDGTLQPEVHLLGGSLQEVRRGTTGDTGATARIDRYTLQVPGTYYVRVSRARGQSGFSTGDYKLTVMLDGIGTGNPVLSESTGTIELNTPAEGTLTNAQWANVWMYSAEAGEQINLTITRTDGTLIPNIDIQDINGQSLRLIRQDNAGDFAQMTGYRFPNAGQYRIVAVRADQQNGYTEGDYSLLIEPQE